MAATSWRLEDSIIRLRKIPAVREKREEVEIMVPSSMYEKILLVIACNGAEFRTKTKLTFFVIIHHYLLHIII